MFSTKVVLITGASSGIGAGTAVRFAKEGAILSLTGRNKQQLEEVGRQCEKAGASKPLLIIGDVTNDGDVKNIVDTTIKTYGKLDVLVNNAGVMNFAPLGSPKAMEVYDKVLKTNTRSVYLLTNLATPHLVETKGNIVNVSSIVALRPYSNVSAYCMSKAAMDHFTRCAALELAPKKVRVNSVNPGIIQTNLQKNSGMPDSHVQGLLEKAKVIHPLGRVGQPEDIAKAILFLASDQADFITGEIMSVDGGSAVNSAT